MRTRFCPFFLALAMFAGVHHAAAQGTTAFTYQGQLRDNGTNAYGSYTMIFRLYDASTNGNQVGVSITNTPNLFNGLFTVTLDFGASVFKGNARWLDITVTNGPTTEELWPRVQVLPSPYALYSAVAATVTNGAISSAQLSFNAVASTNIQNGAITSTQLAFGAVANSNLAVNAVATSNIQDSAITSAKIADGAVSNRDLAIGSILATNIASGQVVRSINGIFHDDVVLSLIGILQQGANTYLVPVGTNLQVSALVPNIQVFTTNGTFSVPTNVTRIKVELWGGGGGGGKGTSSGWNGGGGGAGGYAFNVFNVLPGTNFTVTVGIGGTNTVAGTFSSFGTMLGASGGGAGTNATSSANGGGGIGGATTNSIVSFGLGMATTNSIVLFAGSTGETGGSFGGGKGASAIGPLGGTGGLGGVSPNGTASGAGGSATGAGAGGGGSSAGSNPAPGGTGGPGLVIVTY